MLGIPFSNKFFQITLWSKNVIELSVHLTTKDSSFNSVTTAIGENINPWFLTKLEIKKIRFSFHVNPHIDLIISHYTREDYLELLLPDEFHKLRRCFWFLKLGMDPLRKKNEQKYQKYLHFIHDLPALFMLSMLNTIVLGLSKLGITELSVFCWTDLGMELPFRGP